MPSRPAPRTAHVMRADLARDLMTGLRDARLVSLRTSDERIGITEEFPGR